MMWYDMIGQRYHDHDITRHLSIVGHQVREYVVWVHMAQPVLHPELDVYHTFTAVAHGNSGNDVRERQALREREREQRHI